MRISSKCTYTHCVWDAPKLMTEMGWIFHIVKPRNRRRPNLHVQHVQNDQFTWFVQFLLVIYCTKLFSENRSNDLYAYCSPRIYPNPWYIICLESPAHYTNASFPHTHSELSKTIISHCLCVHVGNNRIL